MEVWERVQRRRLAVRLACLVDLLFTWFSFLLWFNQGFQLGSLVSYVLNFSRNWLRFLFRSEFVWSWSSRTSSRELSRSSILLSITNSDAWICYMCLIFRYIRVYMPLYLCTYWMLYVVQLLVPRLVNWLFGAYRIGYRIDSSCLWTTCEFLDKIGKRKHLSELTLSTLWQSTGIREAEYF